MKSETVGAIAVGAALVVGIAGVVAKEQSKECSPRKVVVECDVLSESGYVRQRFAAKECDGVISSEVLEKTKAVIAGSCLELDDVKVSAGNPPEPVSFACRFRPKGEPTESCMRSKGGKIVDPGDENAMPAAEAVGDGCLPRPCAEVAGIPWR